MKWQFDSGRRKMYYFLMLKNSMGKAVEIINLLLCLKH